MLQNEKPVPGALTRPRTAIAMIALTLVLTYTALFQHSAAPGT